MKERLGLLTVVLLVVANVFLIPLAFKNAQGPPRARGSPSRQRTTPRNPSGARSLTAEPVSSPPTSRRC